MQSPERKISLHFNYQGNLIVSKMVWKELVISMLPLSSHILYFPLSILHPCAFCSGHRLVSTCLLLHPCQLPLSVPHPPQQLCLLRTRYLKSKRRCCGRVLGEIKRHFSLAEVRIQECLFLPAHPPCLTSHLLETFPQTSVINPINISEFSACR